MFKWGTFFTSVSSFTLKQIMIHETLDCMTSGKPAYLCAVHFKFDSLREMIGGHACGCLVNLYTPSTIHHPRSSIIYDVFLCTLKFNFEEIDMQIPLNSLVGRVNMSGCKIWKILIFFNFFFIIWYFKNKIYFYLSRLVTGLS